MGLLDSLLLGLAAVLTPGNLFFCLLGVMLGTLIGALPGIGPLTAIALLVPVTMHMPTETALILLAGIYYGAEYGGSISSILLNVAGTPSSAIACLDGHPMARRGRAGPALLLSALASFAGGLLGIAALVMITPALVDLAFGFGPAEYFAAMLFALLAASVIHKGGARKGIAMMLLGLLLGTVGLDTDSGVARFTVGITELQSGITIIVMAMGLFGVSEVILMMHNRAAQVSFRNPRLYELLPTPQEWRESPGPGLRGGVIGVVMGALPGAGPTIASISAYAAEMRLTRQPERFGQGAVAGLVSPESANNAAAQTAFVPTLSLGIPGSATMAVILGVLLIHGIEPGPMFMTAHGDMFWALVASFLVGNVFLLVLNIPLIGLWVRLLRVPPQWLYPVILVLMAVSVFSLNQSVVSVVVMLIIGMMGYFLRLAGFHLTPVLVGYVLGPLMEENLRRALAISQGDMAILFGSHYSIGLLTASALLLAASFNRRRFAPDGHQK